MTFNSIILNNIKFNFKKYLSFFLVNSFAIMILFMYSNLMYEKQLTSMIPRSARNALKTGYAGVIIFLVVFISYTVTAFIKYRGKEFGVYMILGMTQKNIKKMVFFENVIIVGSSLLVGLISGMIFSRLYYMLFSKIMMLDGLKFNLNYQSVIVTVGIFGVIFLFSTLLGKRAISKISIVEMIKASLKSDMMEKRKYTGIVWFTLMVISLIILQSVKSRYIYESTLTLKLIAWICPTIILIGLYMVIGNFIESIKNIFKRFPDLYNKKILLLTNLSYRVKNYRTMLFVVSLLTSLAIFLIQFGYNMYATAPDVFEKNFFNDIMFVQTSKYNIVSEKELRDVIRAAGGELESYSKIEYVPMDVYKYEGEEKVVIQSFSFPIISERNYNQHMNTQFDIKPGEFMEVVNPSSSMRGAKRDNYEIVITEHGNDLYERLSPNVVECRISEKEFKNVVNDYTNFTLKPNNTPYEFAPLSIKYYNSAINSGEAFIVDHEDYERIKAEFKDKVEIYQKINIKENKDEIFNGVVELLKSKNQLDENFWNRTKGERPVYNDSNIEYINDLRPIYVEEERFEPIQIYGVTLFIFFFVGFLTLIASGIVLYYRVLTGVNDDRERLLKLRKMGMTDKELKELVCNELKILYFIPVLLGGFLGAFSISIVLSPQAVYDKIMLNTSLMIGLYIIIQIIFYHISKSKYLKETMNKR
ncbi:FtsX-like permease family protein [Oceanirhabdus sp. W0125-5]|uniref:FtsX-like permease family protein n=1 Tax=Oceanirhabdus sp. W0125-5 TaxID=2999116 RepID=UPI0022F30A8B|nr:ABC transporter permease [Oceanirhabdus sp. W0125-5]WBW96858.1 ABC transporter permease [Oceanirhabdus sp. W0125-5]